MYQTEKYFLKKNVHQFAYFELLNEKSRYTKLAMNKIGNIHDKRQIGLYFLKCYVNETNYS